jgi:hypothetical protein
MLFEYNYPRLDQNKFQMVFRTSLVNALSATQQRNTALDPSKKMDVLPWPSPANKKGASSTFCLWWYSGKIDFIQANS